MTYYISTEADNIRRMLRIVAGENSRCISHADLGDYAHGRTRDCTSLEIESHLVDCERCLDRLRSIAAYAQSAAQVILQVSAPAKIESIWDSVETSWVYTKELRGEKVVFTWVNHTFAAAIGETCESMVGKSDSDYNQNGSEVKAYRSADIALLKGTKSRCTIQQESWTFPDGEKKYFRTVKEIGKRPDGTRQILAVATDITEEVLLKRRLAQESSIIDSVMNALPCGVSIKSLEGVIRRCNRQFAVDNGYSSVREAIGNSNQEHWSVSTADRFSEHDRYVAESLAVIGPFEDTIVFKDGLEVDRVILKAPVLSPSDPHRAIAVLCLSADRGDTFRNESLTDALTCLQPLIGCV